MQRVAMHGHMARTVEGNMKTWLLFLALLAPLCAAEASDETEVRTADSDYWKTYNACDLQRMGTYLTSDAEFYHDKGGLTLTRDAIVDSIRNGVCGNPQTKIRREEVPGSISFHSMAGGFAFVSGTHRFYVTETGKQEYLDGQAQFAVVWQHVGDQWQMRRVVSYDHGPAPYIPPAPSVTLSPAELSSLAGTFASPADGNLVVTVEGDHLRMNASNVSVSLYAKSASEFFANERDLGFKFTDSGTTLTVFEKGGPVSVAKRVSATAN
jgi:ketosteroid isomerase-like protein